MLEPEQEESDAQHNGYILQAKGYAFPQLLGDFYSREKGQHVARSESNLQPFRLVLYGLL